MKAADYYAGKCRLVQNAKRRRKLEQRGVYLRWCPELQGWLWEPRP